MIEVIGLDGDDTSWHSEQIFVELPACIAQLDTGAGARA